MQETGSRLIASGSASAAAAAAGAVVTAAAATCAAAGCGSAAGGSRRISPYRIAIGIVVGGVRIVIAGITG